MPTNCSFNFWCSSEMNTISSSESQIHQNTKVQVPDSEYVSDKNKTTFCLCRRVFMLIKMIVIMLLLSSLEYLLENNSWHFECTNPTYLGKAGVNLPWGHRDSWPTSYMMDYSHYVLSKQFRRASLRLSRLDMMENGAEFLLFLVAVHEIPAQLALLSQYATGTAKRRAHET